MSLHLGTRHVARNKSGSQGRPRPQTVEAGSASSISSRSSTLDQCQSAALKRELLFCGGCLLMVWAIGAAASSGFIITAFFVVVAAGQFVSRAANNILAKLGKRSALRPYATGLVALCLFGLVIARACYIATVLVNTELRTPVVPLIAVSIGPALPPD